jgi:uncharacterized SAM-binding protein YcdF (DUF218 family)
MQFVLSKLVWLVAQPSNLFFILMIAAVLLLWTRWRRFARRLLLVLVVVGLVVAVVPVGTWLLLPLENRFAGSRLPERIDGIIVLGGALDQFVTKARGQPAVGSGVARLLAFADLARRYPQAKLVFSGGSGELFRQDVKEAEAAKLFFRQIGLDPARISFEARSRNTAEGAQYSHALVKPQTGEVWVLITSARHMPRAYGCFRAIGWPVVPYPVDYATDGKFHFHLRFGFASGLGGLSAGLKEWVGLLYYYWLSRIPSIFPGPEPAAAVAGASK